jgi:acyl-CoA synthetase (AMP-forming)/AMP-acid ligase II/SAM-dependent methyltransferase
MNPIVAADNGIQADYFEFALRKASRGAADIYASFQPFNEATRALHAVFPTLKRQRIERILVLWDRTGYLANLMQALFPEARIEVTWDNEMDVLGRTGFSVWMAGKPGPRPWICDHTQKLPFEQDDFDLVIALDVLHRVEWPKFLDELDRVMKPDGAAVFPHIHMANSEPDPFFERGGTYRLGTEYQAGLDQHPADRVGWVQGEPTLFKASFENPHRLASHPDTSDYNGLAAWVPPSWLDREEGLLVGAWEAESLSSCRGFLNPLVEYVLSHSEIRINPEHQHGFVQYMFDRHPVYETYLRPCDQMQLTDLQVRLLHRLETGSSIGQFQNEFGISLEELKHAVLPLTSTGALLLAPFSANAHAMQTFVGTNKLLLQPDQSTLAQLMAMRLAKAPGSSLVHDEETLTTEETLDLVDIFANRLLQDGVNPGDHVVCQLAPSWECCILGWSVMKMGAVLVPFEPGIPIPEGVSLPKLAFHSLVQLEEWLEDWDEEYRTLPKISGSDCATVLHTSGTTGSPKGVPLTHHQLVESAMAMTVHFELNDESVLMMNSSIETMSGLRNSLFLPWTCGGGVAICPLEQPFVPARLLELAKKRKANVISANPTLFRMLLSSREPHPKWQAAFCTGAPLSADIKKQWLETAGIPLLNYYGLTETTGFCTAEKNDFEGGIGLSVLGVTQIKDGQLRLFSRMIASHYALISGDLPVADPDGWYWTGDDAAWNENGTLSLLGRGTRRYKTSRSVLVRLDDLEAELVLHPHVEDAHSIVVPHHESETAQVYLKLSASIPIEEIQAWLRTRWGKDKTPLHFTIVDRIPRNAAGKVASNFGKK